MSDRLEQGIKDTLTENTAASTHMQEEVWRRISQRIEEEPLVRTQPPGLNGRKRGARRRRRLVSVVSIAAAALLVLFFTTAEPGQAMVNQIKQWFVPQKMVEEELEGIPETSQVELQEGKQGYVIYFDEDMFRLIRGEETDRIEPVNDPGERYPDVYMEISRSPAAPKAAADAIRGTMGGEPKVTELQEVDEPVRGWEFRAIGGTGGKAWDDPITRYYTIDDGAGGSFVIRQKYFLEAEEGYGARFTYMLKQFHIVENK